MYVLADLIAFALTIAHEISDDELRIYKEAVDSKDKLG